MQQFNIGDIVCSKSYPQWCNMEVIKITKDGDYSCMPLSGVYQGEAGLFEGNIGDLVLVQAARGAVTQADVLARAETDGGWATADAATILAALAAETRAASGKAFPVPAVNSATAKLMIQKLERPLDWRMQYDDSSARRKDQPVTEGVLKYMPAAIRLMAEVSRLGNEKHNPGEPLHHARGKSTDHLDCAARHIMDADQLDKDSGLIEALHAMWRLGVYVQEQCELKYGWPKAPNARG